MFTPSSVRPKGSFVIFDDGLCPANPCSGLLFDPKPTPITPRTSSARMPVSQPRAFSTSPWMRITLSFVSPSDAFGELKEDGRCLRGQNHVMTVKEGLSQKRLRTEYSDT